MSTSHPTTSEHSHARKDAPQGPRAARERSVADEPRDLAPAIGRVVATPPSTPTPEAPDASPLTAAAIYSLRKATREQTCVAAPSAGELASSQRYAAEFGNHAPPRAQLVEHLRLAAAWSAEEARATRWLAYARDQRLLAWDAALQQLERFHDAWTLAEKHVPALATQYPSTARLLGARKAAALRGAKARGARKARKAPTTAAAATTTEPTPPAPPAH
jgi:hypothetical protein